MIKLRYLLPTLTIFSILFATDAQAQSSLTSIQDTVLNANGTPFNGALIVTWNGFTAPSGGPIAPHSTSAQIYNGVLSILLVPTTTAAGAYYLATYNSSDGTTTWSETWEVPASSTPLTLNQVRVASGTTSTGTTGSSGSISLPIPISDVSNLSTTLTTLSSSISTLTSQVSALTVTPVFVDGETPGGTINASNRTFTLASAPSPATSLDLYRNGLVQAVVWITRFRVKRSRSSQSPHRRRATFCRRSIAQQGSDRLPISATTNLLREHRTRPAPHSHFPSYQVPHSV